MTGMLALSSIAGNRQRLDGGAMFGNAPRAIWQKWLAPDELGRIGIACRALLVERGERKILLETGIGAFFEPKLKERYGVVEAEHVLLRSLERRGLSDADIDVVILSHLHFDHAGGLLAAFEAAEPPKLLFPRAQFVVGRTAFERAKSPHPRDRASFIPQLPGLLEASGRLVVVDDEQPTLPELGEAFRFWRTSGHTPGMLHTEVCGREGSVFFCADLIPGAPWVHLPITMGYDRYPERLIDEKRALYERISQRRNSWLFFTHDPDLAAARLKVDERGRFSIEDGRPELDRMDLGRAAAS